MESILPRYGFILTRFVMEYPLMVVRELDSRELSFST
jgi:hypothetical protein